MWRAFFSFLCSSCCASQDAAKIVGHREDSTALTELQQNADRSRLRDLLRTKALACGAEPKGVDFFSPDRPGELLTPEQWLTTASKDLPFMFLPSRGGGANPLPGPRTNSKELVNPTPQQLGQHADAIKRGELKVVHQ